MHVILLSQLVNNKALTDRQTQFTVRAAVTIYTCTSEMVASNLIRVIGLPENIFVVFLSLFSQMPEWYLDLVATDSSHIFSMSLLFSFHVT